MRARGGGAGRKQGDCVAGLPKLESVCRYSLGTTIRKKMCTKTCFVK